MIKVWLSDKMMEWHFKKKRTNDSNKVLGNILAEENVKEYFAPAEYLVLSESAKLSRKSFEKMNSGVKAQGGADLESSFFMERQLAYEQTIIDSRIILPTVISLKPLKLSTLADEQEVTFQAWVRNNAAAKSPFGGKKKPLSENEPAKVKLAQEDYVIANLDDLSIHNSLGAESEAEAKVMLSELLEQNPTLEGRLQVMPAYEAA
jgi:hypothetical protein